jgi:hypothetical protein
LLSIDQLSDEKRRKFMETLGGIGREREESMSVIVLLGLAIIAEVLATSMLKAVG